MKRLVFNIRQHVQSMSISAKIRFVVLFIMGVTAALLLVVVLQMVHYSSQYGQVVENFTIASNFNNEFRSKMDEKMFKYAAKMHTLEEADPWVDIESARSIVAQLESTTTSEDSLRRLYLIGRELTALENGIWEMANPDEKWDVIVERQKQGLLRQGWTEEMLEGYVYYQTDWKMSRLERKIYPLTRIIEEDMLQYIFWEAQSMTELHAQVSGAVRSSIVLVIVITAGLFALLFLFAMRTAASITRPLRQLNENIRLVGEGDFTVRPVQSSNNELQTMSDTLDGMVERMVVLMDNIRGEQENLRRTELELLQAQINPHFLYNAFDTVIWLAEDNQSQQVVSTVESLSNFFRTSLSKGRNFIPLREEFLQVRSYLEIQQTRYSDILEYEINYPEALGDYIVLKLTLQPLVENALYHGVKNKRGMGKIKVTATQIDSLLHFEVWDNGRGVEPERLEELQQALAGEGKSGYGMVNVQERIQLYYGKQYGMHIESEYGLYTLVTVDIPAQNNPPIS